MKASDSTGLKMQGKPISSHAALEVRRRSRRRPSSACPRPRARPPPSGRACRAGARIVVPAGERDEVPGVEALGVPGDRPDVLVVRREEDALARQAAAEVLEERDERLLVPLRVGADHAGGQAGAQAEGARVRVQREQRHALGGEVADDVEAVRPGDLEDERRVAAGGPLEKRVEAHRRPFRVAAARAFSYTPSVSLALRSQLSSRAAARPASPIAAAFAGSSSTSDDDIRQRLGRANRDQVAALPVGDEVLGSLALAGDDRRALRHRLGVDEPERLVPARAGPRAARAP